MRVPRSRFHFIMNSTERRCAALEGRALKSPRSDLSKLARLDETDEFIPSGVRQANGVLA